MLLQSAAIILYLIDEYDKEGKFSYSDGPQKYLLQQWLAFQVSGKYNSYTNIEKQWPNW